ncbi:MAG: DUF2924 domain-containing protein [Afipia sp.]|nr:DUF2924 domain-containing protein [Afipia sp.]
MPRDKSTKPAHLDIEAELTQLETASLDDLRKRHRLLVRADPPKAFGSDLLRRTIAQRIQEKAYGGLPRPTQRALDQLIKAVHSQPSGNVEIARRIKPGSVLVREWKGTSHRVTVLAEGFAYRGTTYGNLSEIASSIAGSRWNGPRFFGLRPAPTKSGKFSSVATK